MFDSVSSGTIERVSIKGSPYTHFNHALELGDLNLIRLCAAELPRVDLGDALRICFLMRDNEALYDRACAKWIARLVLEGRDMGLDEISEALDAFRAMPVTPTNTALRDLGALLAAQGLARPLST